MGCRILEGNGEGDSQGAVFYCSTTMHAFGPVMGSYEEASLFHKWLPEDPRTYKDGELTLKYYDFRNKYACSYCGRFFGEMDVCWKLDSERMCDRCDGRKKINLEKAVKEWRYDAEDLEFIEYGKSPEEVE